MSKVIKKMDDHMPESFFRLHIFLAANMAVSPLHCRAAVEAILFFSLGDMRQSKIFLKNKYKNIQAVFLFPVTEQFR